MPSRTKPSSVAAAEQLASEVASRPTGAQIKIADFDFDLDKDGKIDPFEQKVKNALMAADTDGSGTLTPAEFVSVLKGMAATEKENKALGRKVVGLSCLVVLLIGALTGVSIVGAVVGGCTRVQNAWLSGGYPVFIHRGPTSGRSTCRSKVGTPAKEHNPGSHAPHSMLCIYPYNCIYRIYMRPARAQRLAASVYVCTIRTS